MKHIFLDEWQETVGNLVDIEGDSMILEGFRLFLYPAQEDFLKKAAELKGEKVSVLRTDSKEIPYRIIKISKSMI